MGPDPDDLDACFSQAIQLAPDGVELTVRRYETGPLAQSEGGEEANDELMSVGSEGDALRRVLHQPREAAAHCLRLGEGALPLVVEELGGVKPGAGLRIEPAVGPGLVGVAGEQQPLAHTKMGA